MGTLNEQIKARRAELAARVVKYDTSRGICSFCHVVFQGTRAAHQATEQHRLAAEGVTRSMNTYQGEVDAEEDEG